MSACCWALCVIVCHSIRRLPLKIHLAASTSTKGVHTHVYRHMYVCMCSLACLAALHSYRGKSMQHCRVLAGCFLRTWNAQRLQSATPFPTAGCCPLISMACGYRYAASAACGPTNHTRAPLPPPTVHDPPTVTVAYRDALALPLRLLTWCAAAALRDCVHCSVHFAATPPSINHKVCTALRPYVCTLHYGVRTHSHHPHNNNAQRNMFIARWPTASVAPCLRVPGCPAIWLRTAMPWTRCGCPHAFTRNHLLPPVWSPPSWLWCLRALTPRPSTPDVRSR
jgi:hypothetical protein